MKTAAIVAAATLLTLAPLRAQTLRPEAVNGAVLGGLAGAVIGHNSGELHHNGWRGAAYGAGAGLLIGSIVGEANQRRSATQVPVPDYPRTYVYRQAPAYYETPAYSYYGDTTYAPFERRPDYRASGAVLGGIAGAIIGHNSGDLRHNGWRGAAYGAGLGYVLGSIAEHNARRREAAENARVAVVPQSPAGPEGPAGVAANSSATVTPPPAPTSRMAAANKLFGR